MSETTVVDDPLGYDLPVHDLEQFEHLGPSEVLEDLSVIIRDSNDRHVIGGRDVNAVYTHIVVGIAGDGRISMIMINSFTVTFGFY